MTQPDYTDARRHPRATLANPVRLAFAMNPSETASYTANISESGMFVGSTSPPPIGTMVRFTIDCGSGSSPSLPDEVVQGIGVVVWIRLKSKRLDEPCGMGIEFGALSEKSREWLRCAVTKALARNCNDHTASVSLADGG